MTLVRVLHAEGLKLKRTIALKMVVIAPVALVLLIGFITSQAPFSTLRRSRGGNDWTELTRLTLVLWTLLLLPLFMALETALVAGLDHAENHWKNLLTRPVPRWTFYVTKLLVVFAMIVAGTTVLICAIIVAGLALPKLQPELHFGSPIPFMTMFAKGAEVVGLVFLALTIQHWVSLRSRAFSVTTAVGIIAMITGYLIVAGLRDSNTWPRYFPWALPMLGLVRPPQDVAIPLWISACVGVVVASLGCYDFCRREVK